jgi:aminoglycoside 6'-N-acetyltransferase I
MRQAIRIVDLTPDRDDMIAQAAGVLTAAFHVNSPGAWSSLEDALQEVREMTAPDRIARAALAGEEVVGWIGGLPQYDGNVWELHPLVVKPACQGQGIGTLLVRDFEALVKGRGGLTITLGTDDEDGMTSLSAADLYTETWQKIRDIRNLKRHPYAFYLKLGYTIIGVVPDANGRGKPDIIMGKRV